VGAGGAVGADWLDRESIRRERRLGLSDLLPWAGEVGLLCVPDDDGALGARAPELRGLSTAGHTVLGAPMTGALDEAPQARRGPAVGNPAAALARRGIAPLWR
jgi:hypothetical protein